MAIWDGFNLTGTSDRKFTDRLDRTDEARDKETAWYQSNYKTWRSVFNGQFLEQTTEGAKDPKSKKKSLKYPAKYNMPRAYGVTHAAGLWGTQDPSHEADLLFRYVVDEEVPGMKAHTEIAKSLQDTLSYFWADNQHHLRPAAATQQWAGGCVLKASWQPWSDTAVFGTVIEQPQPESFYPVWNPVNVADLVAAKIVFRIPMIVAMDRYNVTPDMLGVRPDDEEPVKVVEYWDRQNYKIVLGEKHVPGRWLHYNPETHVRTYSPMEGPNPWIHPLRGHGLVPIKYVPRILTEGFYGDSLVYELMGLMQEINKNVADFGDALSDASHVKGMVADFRGGSKRLGLGRSDQKIIPIPKSGFLDAGPTPAGARFQARFSAIPGAEIPSSAPEFMTMLDTMADTVAHLTPAARGGSKGSSGFQVAMEMLPTTNLIDWARSHWANALCGPGGLHDVLAAIWFRAGLMKENDSILLPRIDPAMFRCRTRIKFRNTVPRDRLQEVQEITQLVTAKVISPKEALRRLGDVEDLDAVVGETYWFIEWIAILEAIVAGRPIQLAGSPGEESGLPPLPAPAIAGGGQTAVKQPAKQPEGQKKEKA
jgi:hypothetical protein